MKREIPMDRMLSFGIYAAFFAITSWVHYLRTDGWGAWALVLVAGLGYAKAMVDEAAKGRKAAPSSTTDAQEDV